jgi:hypothetical protein
MPPRKKLLDISSGAGYPAFRIGRVRRLKLEQKIARSIPEAAWNELIEATRDYRADTDLERNTPPISPAKDRVKKLRAAAEAIWDVHEERVSDKRRTPYRHIRADKLYALALASRDMMKACDSELGALARGEAEDSGFRVGEAWDWWIWRLTRILKKAGLPTGVRKDTGDIGRTSPFVLFVAELQRYLPEKFRRHTRKKALAAAIDKARKARARKIGSHKLDPVEQ